MIRALIFDLDNCLAPAREVGAALYEPAFEAIRQANNGSLSPENLRAALEDCWDHAFDWVAKRHHFSESMRQAGWQAFQRLEVASKMTGYEDLSILSQLPTQRFLVTSGFRRLQESKVAALDIANQFVDIQIDAIDEPNRLGKQKIFALISERYQLHPDETLVVGDSEHSEILAGERLGIRTVQTLRPGIPHSERATYHIRSLVELKRLLESSDALID